MDNNIPRNIFQDLIKEVVRPEEIELGSIKQHESLSPLIWEGENMKKDIRATLLKNAKAFIVYAGIENVRFNDIVITGSMANYNYSKNSDIDVHIILDFNQISENVDLVNDLLSTKKKLWSKTYDTSIKNHEIELYFQNTKEPHHATGIFSILNDLWIKKPTNKILDINTENVRKKTSQFINNIDELEKMVDDERFIKKYDELKEKLKKFRQSGLEDEGEYSTENIVFKLLRNLGHLDRLFELKNKHITKNLTIKQ